jgi:hypothetical protein
MTVKKTDGRAARSEPAIRWSGREWKLVLTTVVSATYTAAWMVFAARAPRVAKAAPPDVAATRPVWLTDLPAASRPRFSLPPGWVMAVSPPRARPVVMRRAAVEPRLRTRSS